MTQACVLIVDDDVALLQALPETVRLRMDGVVVDTADSGAARAASSHERLGGGGGGGPETRWSRGRSVAGARGGGAGLGRSLAARSWVRSWCRSCVGGGGARSRERNRMCGCWGSGRGC